MTVLAVCARLIWRAKLKMFPVFDARSTAIDFMTAATIVPFLVMFATPISPRFLSALLQSSMSAIWVAGGLGLVVVLRELLTPPNEHRRPIASAAPTLNEKQRGPSQRS